MYQKTNAMKSCDLLIFQLKPFSGSNFFKFHPGGQNIFHILSIFNELIRVLQDIAKMCFHSAIYYSDIYKDGSYEYQHIILPRELVNLLPADRLLAEAEWHRLGIRISPTWENYMRHQPEPHVLLFRRPLMRRFTTRTFDD